MKQVLFIGMSPNKGGIETFMMNIFMTLEGRGFHFTFINIFKKKLAYQNLIISRGGTIRQVILGSSLFEHLFRYSKAKHFFKEHHDYDIIHLNAVTINVIFWLKAAVKYNIPKLIIHSHNDGILYNSKYKMILAKLLSKYNVHYVNKNKKIVELAVSKDAGKWMFHNDRFSIIKNGINCNKFKFNNLKKRNIKRKLGLLGNKVIITVARLEPQKNYFRILKIFQLIHNEHPKTKLVIVGDGSQRLSLIRFSYKLGIMNDVKFLGSINNVNEVLNIANLMLMPSKYEGFPFSLIEAQAVGVPALVSKEAIPQSSNITNRLKYLSLTSSNYIWSKTSCDLLKNSLTTSDRLFMNTLVKESPYNVKNTVSQISKFYLN